MPEVWQKLTDPLKAGRPVNESQMIRVSDETVKRVQELGDYEFAMTPGSTMTIEPKAFQPRWEYCYSTRELEDLNRLGSEGWQVAARVGERLLMIREILPGEQGATISASESVRH